MVNIKIYGKRTVSVNNELDELYSDITPLTSRDIEIQLKISGIEKEQAENMTDEELNQAVEDYILEELLVSEKFSGRQIRLGDGKYLISIKEADEEGNMYRTLVAYDIKTEQTLDAIPIVSLAVLKDKDIMRYFSQRMGKYAILTEKQNM